MLHIYYFSPPLVSSNAICFGSIAASYMSNTTRHSNGTWNFKFLWNFFPSKPAALILGEMIMKKIQHEAIKLKKIFNTLYIPLPTYMGI